MSNKGRTQVDRKPCTFDGSTERDSNGQCHCRNVLYRLTHKPNQTDEQVTAVTKKFNAALKANKTVDEARTAASPAAAARKQAPAADKKAPKETPVSADPPATTQAESVAPAADFAQEDADLLGVAEAFDGRHASVCDDAGWHCTCGFTGKGTGPSIRAHVASETKKAGL